MGDGGWDGRAEDRAARFARIFQLPPAMVDYVDLVVTEAELELVLVLGADALSAADVAEAMGLPDEEAEELLTGAYHRHVVEREPGDDGEARYSVGTFYERLNPLAMYEQWGAVPAEVRQAVIEWDLEAFVKLWEPAIRQIQADPDAAVVIPNRDVVLLEEALEMVEAAEVHVVVPCDCRSIIKACDRPVENCVRLDEGALATLEHGMGRRISKEVCKRIVVEADRAGLMHTGDRAWRENGLYGFCSCCACDCFPIRAAERVDLEQAWPRRHYTAARDQEVCVGCGVCVERCHFGAFHVVEGDGWKGTAVAFDGERCWGCGICATACPESAIEMELRC